MEGKISKFLVLLLFLSLFRTVHASENYFDFKPKSNLTDFRGTLDLEFQFDMPESLVSRFVVKPRVLSGLVKFTDAAAYIKMPFEANIPSREFSVDDSEIKNQTLWSNFPTLSKEFKIKIAGNFYATKLWFEVLDTKTGKVYETKKRKIWSYGVFDNYREKLNQNLSKW